MKNALNRRFSHDFIENRPILIEVFVVAIFISSFRSSTLPFATPMPIPYLDKTPKEFSRQSWATKAQELSNPLDQMLLKSLLVCSPTLHHFNLLGDFVIPLYTPQCRKCDYCTNPKTNLCQAIRMTQGQGLMPDGTKRFKCKGEEIAHFMGCSTFSEYTVVADISVCKVGWHKTTSFAPTNIKSRFIG